MSLLGCLHLVLLQIASPALMQLTCVSLSLLYLASVFPPLRSSLSLSVKNLAASSMCAFDLSLDVFRLQCTTCVLGPCFKWRN